MKNLTLLFLISFLNFSLAFANGGVVDENYFKKTGNIRLLQKADISNLYFFRYKKKYGTDLPY
jgi:hypothetical protein